MEKQTGMSTWIAGLLFVVALCGMPESRAEVVASSSTHFVLRHEATSSLTVEQMWLRLLAPANWWHSEHTYSGDAKNMSLTPEAGGAWREDWSGGSVEHGQVMLVRNLKMLRLNAPFGPLQGLGAYVIWTITLEASAEGCKVFFDEVATGPPSANLASLAPAVDGVKTQALKRLVTVVKAIAP